jgi:AcrR family transcriptional regulator
MPRTLDPAAHALRRDAFVDVAQRLIQTKGYEQMSIEVILGELDASKGAFYHYFDSKEALLAGVVDRMVEAATATARATVNDPDQPALDKLTGLFAEIAQWKGERTDLMIELVRVWFSDGNAVVRDRLRRGVQARLTPLLAAIVRQRVTENAFSCRSPEHTASVFVALVLGLNDAAGQLLLARRAGAISFEEVEFTVAAYSEAFERILGLPAGSWPPADEKVLHFWFD